MVVMMIVIVMHDDNDGFGEESDDGIGDNDSHDHVVERNTDDWNV